MMHSVRTRLVVFGVVSAAVGCSTTPCEDYCDRQLRCSQEAGVSGEISDDATDECVSLCEDEGPADDVLQCYVDAVDKGECADGWDCFDTGQ